MGITAGIGSALSGAASVGNLAYQIVKDQSLTGAEQEANAFNANQAELNRKFQSSEAEIARQWQEDQYLKYNSPAAQIQQYKDAGLNASLMYGSSTGIGASTSTSAPTGSSASSVSPKGGDVAGALSMFGALEKLMAEVDNVRADTNKKKSETTNIDIENAFAPIIKNLETQQMRTTINKGVQDIKESESRINLNNSEIEINGHRINLLDEQAKTEHTEQILKTEQSILAHFDAEKAKSMMPYVQEYYQSAINLNKAHTEESFSNALRSFTDAQLNMLEHMKEDKFLEDGGYYDSMIEQANWQAKQNKRSYKWQPVNSVLGTVTKIALAVGGFALAGPAGAAGGAALGSGLWLPNSTSFNGTNYKGY